MIRSIHHPLRHGAVAAFAAALLVLVSCGGGGGVVGSGGTGRTNGVAVGTVNGFGSVLVDGDAFDDRAAVAVSRSAPGTDSPADVRFGQRVAVEYAQAGVASVIRVEAAVVGAITGVVATGQFTVLGQTVLINTRGSAGPITLFGSGYTRALDLRTGDFVEVHGVLVRQGASSQIQATRIDRLTGAPAYLRATGIVSALSTGGDPVFTLGALSVAASGVVPLPAGTPLAEGQAVTVLALPSSLTAPSAGALKVSAAEIRIRDRADAGMLPDVVSGVIAALDAQARTFTLGSQRVRYAGASVAPAAVTLVNGQYVVAKGTLGADGALVADSLVVRDSGTETEAELKGNVTGWVAATRSFSVRGVAVDASHASLQSCPAAGLSEGLFVEVQGSVSSSGVVAASVHCEDEPAGATVEREGTAAAIDVAGKTFALQTEHSGSIAVQWSDATYFGRVTPQTLAGKKVQVQGTLQGGVLVATKVTVDD